MTIKEIERYSINRLKQNNTEDYILKTKILISNSIKQNKEYLVAHDNEEIEEDKILEIKENIEKLIIGIPIQYITCKQEFMGLNFFVNKDVLIPQPDTEILVEEVIDIAKKEDNYKILDLCTGSGAIAISLKKILKKPKVYGTDISIKALEVAKKNAKLNETDVEFIKSDLFENINEKFSIIVSNPPYIKTDKIRTLSKDVQNEPKLALDGGKDGLDFYKKIVNNAYKYLEPDGYFCLEIGYDQKEDVIKLIENSNKYKNIYSKKDLSGNDRIVVCNKK